MRLTERQLRLIKEAGIKIPDGTVDDRFMTAEDEERLEDYVIECLGPNQEMTDKAEEIVDLLCDLAKDN